MPSDNNGNRGENNPKSEAKMELEAQSKDKEKQKEEDINEETERFTTQEMARGFSLLEEVLLGFGHKTQT